jgi:nucleoside phosphorylase
VLVSYDPSDIVVPLLYLAPLRSINSLLLPLAHGIVFIPYSSFCMSSDSLTLDTVTIGIITALPKEFASVLRIFGLSEKRYVAGKGAGREYYLGVVNASNGGRHIVAAALTADMANNCAAIRATLMLEHCSNIRLVIMTGIAGAVPFHQRVREHVRLGDIVVSDKAGVIQYDLDKESIDKDGKPTYEIRHPPRPISATGTEVLKYLEAEELTGSRPWEPYIDAATRSLGPAWARPNNDADVLHIWEGGTPEHVTHPYDPDRRDSTPRIFQGPIASANKLLKNPTKRDKLRDAFSVKAVEMEGSGIADAAWHHDISYIVIRGTCDYCNPEKGDHWQKYAAIIAAAFTRSFLERLRVETPAVPTGLYSANYNDTQLLPKSTVPHTSLSPAPSAPAGSSVQAITVNQPAVTLPATNNSNSPIPSINAVSSNVSQDVADPTSAPTAPEVGQELANSVSAHLESLNIEEAIVSAQAFEKWLDANGHTLTKKDRAEYYELLARVAIREMHLARASGRKPDLTRVKTFLARAADANP